MRNYHKSTTNYTGRTVDMLLLQLVTQPSDEVIVHPNVSSSPRIVTGIEKLVQRYALLFLTMAGTVKNVEWEGTDFLTLLQSGRIYDMTTLTGAATAANKAVCDQIKTEDSRLQTPADEALDHATVTDLAMNRSTATVTVTVSITTVAGDTYVYTTPLKVGV